MTADEAAALVRVHVDAVSFYRANLTALSAGAMTARAFLSARAIPPAAVDAYGLGYAPPGWTALSTHLRSLGHTPERLLAAGVCLPGRHGAVLDRFRGRLMFPVQDPSGRAVAFLGRLLPPNPAAGPAASRHARDAVSEQVKPPAREDLEAHEARPPVVAEPKYLNSPQTALYRKGEVLYGLGAAPARHALAAGARPVLVEGPLDAIAVTWSQRNARGGVPGAQAQVGVAPCGTALTPAQVAVLDLHAGPLADRGVTVAFDADPAGQQAALRAYELLRERGAWPSAAVLPAGLDPCELAHRRGPAALALVLHHAVPLADLVVDAELDQRSDQLHWAEGRTHAVRAIARVLAGLPGEHVARQVHRLALRLGLEHRDLTAMLTETVSPSPPPAPPPPALDRPDAAGPAAVNAAQLAAASYPRQLGAAPAPRPPSRQEPTSSSPPLAPAPVAPARPAAPQPPDLDRGARQALAAATRAAGVLSTASRRSAPTTQPAAHHANTR